MAADDTPSVLQLQQYAEQLARDMYPSQGGQYDQQDAARHMLAAGTLARKYGADTAEFLGKAHEHVTSPLKSLMTLFGGKMPNDYEQDLYNNALGIQLSKGAKSQADLEELVNRYAEGASKDKTYGRPWTGKPKKNYAAGGAVANMTEDPGWDDGGAVGPDQAGVNKMVAMQSGGLVYDPAEIERMAAEL